MLGRLEDAGTPGKRDCGGKIEDINLILQNSCMTCGNMFSNKG